MSASLKAHVALFIVALVYGANYTIAKVVLDDGYLHPVGFITLRIVFGALLFNIFHQIWIKEKVDRKDLPLLALCALFGTVLNQLFFFLGLRETTPINASLIMTTTPILILVVSALMIGERITFVKLLGIVLGAVGAVMIISSGKEVSFQSNQALGNFFIIINASAYGVYLVLVKKLMMKYNAFTVIRWVFTFGALMIVPFGSYYLYFTDWASFTPVVIIAVGYVLLFTTFLVYLLNALALKLVSASIVGIYIYLQPVIATVIALAIGNDQLTFVKILAATLIFTGVFLVSMPTEKRRKAAQVTASR